MVRLTSVDSRYWRMLSVRWQREPLSGAGAAQSGGRWNRVKQPALYLAAKHATAVAEFHRELVKPGTLAAYDVQSSRIADLTVDGDIFDARTVLRSDWRTLSVIEKVSPPGWRIADTLIEAGADGALVGSAQVAGGINLVLWRWSADGSEGARVHLLDPFGDLR